MGSGASATTPADRARLRIHQETQAGILDKRTRLRTVSVSSSAQFSSKRVPLIAVVVDGARAYDGRVVELLEQGALVDFGCQRQGFLPAAAVRGAIEVGAAVTVYPQRKQLVAGRVTLALAPGERSWTVPAADGVTALNGTVEAVGPAGAYIDLGCERVGLLPAEELADQVGLPVGSAVTVCITSELEPSWVCLSRCRAAQVGYALSLRLPQKDSNCGVRRSRPELQVFKAWSEPQTSPEENKSFEASLLDGVHSDPS